FAVTYHRKVRTKRTLATELTGIQGVGPRRARLLLRRFGSVQGVREAPLESVAAAVGRSLAGKIKASLEQAPASRVRAGRPVL
ncbi:MAG: helix-hairpin-helix domain-containing protein, partial [Acidobacteriota bacterium]